MEDNELGNKTYFVEPKPPLEMKNTRVEIYQEDKVTGAWSDAAELTDIEIKEETERGEEKHKQIRLKYGLDKQ